MVTPASRAAREGGALQPRRVTAPGSHALGDGLLRGALPAGAAAPPGDGATRTPTPGPRVHGTGQEDL